MSQRVFVHVSPTWIDEDILSDWFRRLPRGSEVLYRPSPNLAGVDELGEMLARAGSAPLALEGPAVELPSGERLDAVIAFGGGPDLLVEMNLGIAAWKRGVRFSLVPPKGRR